METRFIWETRDISFEASVLVLKFLKMLLRLYINYQLVALIIIYL